MSGISLVDPSHAPADVKPLLDVVQAQLGATPTFVRVLANSPAALEGFLGLFTIAGEGVLDGRTRERIALAIAGQNSCQYCVSAHTALGRGAGLDEAELIAARSGASSEPKAAAALAFANVTAAEFDAATAALSEAEIVEAIAHVALNIFTYLIGKSTKVEIDLPAVKPLQAA